MDVNTIKYHVGGEFEEIGSDAFPGIVPAIKDTLRRFESWGLNPNKVSVGDFNFAFVMPIGGPGSVQVKFHPCPVLVAEHKTTLKSNAYDVILMSVYGTYPTAVDMIALASAKRSDDD